MTMSAVSMVLELILWEMTSGALVRGDTRTWRERPHTGLIIAVII